MASVTNDQFLLACINNSDLSKIDYKKVTEELGLPSVGAASKRFSRWKTKTQAEIANGTAGDDGDSEPKNGSASPTKAKKSPVKKAAAADGNEGTPKKAPAKKTPAKKTPSKKRKLDEGNEEEDGAFKDEPKEDEDAS